MTDETPVRQLADTLVQTLLADDPFTGTALGLRDYDALVPDASAAAQDRLATELAGVAAQAQSLVPETPADAVTRDVVLATCALRQQQIELRAEEYTVSAMPITGPPELFGVLARTTLPDASAAADYLTRVRAAAGWIDGGTERLREGMARGRYPADALVGQAIGWAERALAAEVAPAVAAASPPAGWAGVDTWRAELASAAAEDLMPAVARWRDQLLELAPLARSDSDAGLCALDGGDADYDRAIAIHTTLPFQADDLHRIGLEAVDRLTERARELGAALGLADLVAVRSAVRASTTAMDPQVSLGRAQDAVRRAESRAGEIMPLPLPGPCAVTPMPPMVAESGIAPHYTRPQLDGSRPGTYWFNTLRATAGTGWDLEAVAFHETVPGHHSQLARAQLLTEQSGLPLLQELTVTVHAEGWGLYAERLAGEFGLYSGEQAELGAVYVEMHRAARLVVDTGLHAFGWSRGQARDYLVDNVALAEGFLLNEIDRYIAWPGQALAYLTGQREILRLRELARASLGEAFDLPAFNGALLDSGSLPMPVLAGVVDAWVAAAAG